MGTSRRARFRPAPSNLPGTTEPVRNSYRARHDDYRESEQHEGHAREAEWAEPLPERERGRVGRDERDQQREGRDGGGGIPAQQAAPDRVAEDGGDQADIQHGGAAEP